MKFKINPSKNKSNQLKLPIWLFVSYGGGHVNALLPVARLVREKGIAWPIYLALTTAATTVRAAGLDTLSFSDFIQQDDEEALAKGAELALNLKVKSTDYEESIAYLGLSYMDLAQRLGEEAAAAAYEKYGRQAFLPLSILHRIIKYVQPNLVVATNSPRAERAAIEVAKSLAIPSVCLLDLFGIWERELLAKPDYADALCVLNDSVKNDFVVAGRPSNSIHVTGNPAFDVLNNPDEISCGHEIREKNGWLNHHVIFYASSPEPLESPGVEGKGRESLPRDIEQQLIEVVKMRPDLALWIRRHPSEPSPDEILKLTHPRIRVSKSDMSLAATLHACDEVVVTVSTVGLEAYITGRIVTQVRGSILDKLSPYFEMGVADRELPWDQVGAFFLSKNNLSNNLGRQKQNSNVSAAERLMSVLTAVSLKSKINEGG